ncbi:ribosome recycling factor [Candidatus Roizmanbacteria bacterium]|nr:ribosome recycling factor [Candidatus Roizmanbacteria bacterium]
MDQHIQQTRQQMEKAIMILRQDLGTIRAGRANAAIVEHVRVKVYGGSQELSVAELATISGSDAKTLIISPFDASIIDELERGLQQANLGVTVVQDGQMIRVTIPALTSERRDEFVKLSKTKTEGIRIMIRQIRQEGMKKVQDQFQAKTIAEDEKFRLEKEIQKLTDEFINQTDEALEKKIQELQTI